MKINLAACAALFLLTAAAGAQAPAPQAPATRLLVTSAPQLVNCAPVTFAPVHEHGRHRR